MVTIEKDRNAYLPRRFLRGNRLGEYQEVENGQWKFLVFDNKSKRPKMPKGSLGFRWQKEKDQWNLEMRDGLDGSEIDPTLTFLEDHDEILQASLYDHANKRVLQRGCPVKNLDTDNGRICVTTVYDLLMAQFGVNRHLGGDYPETYDDQDMPYTPAWQEKFTGIDKKTLVKFAREWVRSPRGQKVDA